MEHLRRHAHQHRHTRRGSNMGLGTWPSATTMVEQTRALVARAECTNDTDDGCKKPTSVPTTAIVLAVVLPCVAAACILFYLHRRNVKKLREEDAKDKYKSLDFGLGPALEGRKKDRKVPEMTLTTAKSGTREKGLSLDLRVGSPYMLPTGLHGSRESFHSLSRSTQDPHDPYRPVILARDDASMRSRSRANDNVSIHTNLSGGTDRQGLIKNAQRMSQSHPIRSESTPLQTSKTPEIRFPEPIAVALSPLKPRPHNDALSAPPLPQAALSQPKADTASDRSRSSYIAFNPHNPAHLSVISASSSIVPKFQQTKAPIKSAPGPPPCVQSQEAVVQSNPDTTSLISVSSYGDGFQLTPPSPRLEPTKVDDPDPLTIQPRHPNGEVRRSAGLGIDDLSVHTNRLSMSVRPLPPNDPNDNPEQRANRIRSFYKEYFDDSMPESAGAQTYNDYYEDYGSEYLDGALFDPRNRGFVVAQAPFAEPITRRAMTPPPRAPPRFRSNTGPRHEHLSGGSGASSTFAPPRGMSSLSGRLPAPKRPLPPPTPLASLPTPHKLQENCMVFNPIDFAPPVSFRDRQNGMRPDSRVGSPRPFSSAVRPYTPLVGSFDDLAVMPSPHSLRKSGTFTALDFAPPARFRDPNSCGSDAGSIRSNRSGMSTAGRLAIRNGAYRVSKIPKEVVGTREDLLSSLRPKMNLSTPA